jgi:hypothetical protein
MCERLTIQQQRGNTMTNNKKLATLAIIDAAAKKLPQIHVSHKPLTATIGEILSSGNAKQRLAATIMKIRAEDPRPEVA